MPVRGPNEQPSVDMPAFTLTATLDALTTMSVRVYALTFLNTDSSDRTVTVTDGKGKVFLKAENVAAGKQLDWPMKERGRFFAGGIKFQASVAGVIDAWPDYSVALR